MDKGWNESSFNKGVVIDLLVSSNVVNKAAQVLLTRVSVSSPHHLLKNAFRFASVHHTLLGFLSAGDGNSCVLIVADQSSDQAFRKDNNGVSLYNVSKRFSIGVRVKVSSIIFVSNSGGSEGNDVDLAENT